MTTPKPARCPNPECGSDLWGLVWDAAKYQYRYTCTRCECSTGWHPIAKSALAAWVKMGEWRNGGWQPIETAPKDGTVIDLWIVGSGDTVDFYSPTAMKMRGRPVRHGRACNWRWAHKPPNNPNWYGADGIGYPLSPEVTPTHWMPLPEPPKDKEPVG